MKKKTLSRDGIDFPREQTKNTHNPSFNSGQVQTTRIFKRKEKKGGGVTLHILLHQNPGPDSA